MKVDTKQLPNSRVELVIEQSAENVAKFRKQVIADAKKHVDIKGFRKGANIPEDIIVKHIGEDVIAQMTIEKAIEGIYRDTLRSEKILPVSQAEIQEIISQDPLKVKIQVEIFPEVEIADGYKKIKLEKEEVKVAASEVQAALDDIQTRFTHFHDTDKGHESHMGDRVTIDTDGYENGTILESTSMRDYPLVLGSNLLVPGFEEDIAGMKAGEEKEIDVIFPKDYHNADFAGKKTQFKVTVKKVEHAHKPEFTPEFIQELRGKELDLKGFKELVKSEIAETKEANAAMQQEMQLIDELLKVSKLEVGENLLAQQVEQVFGEIKENIARDGVKVEDYIASLGLDEATYKEKHVKDVALKRLQGELILNKLVDMMNISVEDNEMKAEIEKIMSRYESPDVLKRLEELYVPGNKYYEELKRRMALRKVIDSFFVAKKTTTKKK